MELSGWTSQKLIAAVQQGNFDGVKEAIDRYRMDSNTSDSAGRTLMHWAAQNNRVKIARYLIGRGAKMDLAGGELKETPLQWACRHDSHTFMIRLLLKEGRADIKFKNIYGQDALCIAVQCSNVKVVFLLLQLGASPNEKDLNNETPLLWLFKNKMHDSSDIQRLLIRYRADVTAVDSDSNNILHIAAITGYVNSDTYSVFRIYERDYKTLSNMKNCDNLTPLEIAWKTRDLSMIQFLFDCYCYTQLPYSFPVFLYAFLVVASFVLVQLSGLFLGGMLASLFYLVGSRFSQPTLLWKLRHEHGIAWGIIVSLLANYVFFVEILVHNYWMILIYSTVSVTILSLYKCHTIVPGHISPNRSMQLRTKLVNGIVILGHYDGMMATPLDHSIGDMYKELTQKKEDVELGLPVGPLSPIAAPGALRSRRRSIDMSPYEPDHDDYNSNALNESDQFSKISHKISFETMPLIKSDAEFEGSDSSSDHDDHEPDWGKVKPVKLCTTCMVDRTNANSHCISCDRCMVDLDHHCVFVDNCIGQKNRWWFLLFTFASTAASASVFFMSVYVQNAIYCSEATGLFWGLFAVQKCMLNIVPALALSTYLALAVALWVGSLFFNQAYLIAVESTTYMMIKKFHDFDKFDWSPNCVLRGLVNLAKFLYNGNYTVLPKNEAGEAASKTMGVYSFANHA
jgi:hypothetical protein